MSIISRKIIDVLNMAQTNNTYSVHDSDALQYFALKVYAHEIAVPGGGYAGLSSSSVAITSAVGFTVKR